MRETKVFYLFWRKWLALSLFFSTEVTFSSAVFFLFCSQRWSEESLHVETGNRNNVTDAGIHLWGSVNVKKENMFNKEWVSPDQGQDLVRDKALLHFFASLYAKKKTNKGEVFQSSFLPEEFLLKHWNRMFEMCVTLLIQLDLFKEGDWWCPGGPADAESPQPVRHSYMLTSAC